MNIALEALQQYLGSLSLSNEQNAHLQTLLAGVEKRWRALQFALERAELQKRSLNAFLNQTSLDLENALNNLTEDRNKLEQVLEQSPAMVIITDLDAKIEYANPRFTEVTGFTFDEVRGKNPRILKSGVHPPEAYVDLWKNIISGRVSESEWCNRKKNGDLYWEWASFAPIRGSDGTIIRYLKISEDITARKQAEEALVLTRDQALEASRFKSQLLSLVSHELRTPLGGILGYSELLANGAFGKLTKQQKDVVNQVIESSHYLTQIVNDLLDEAELSARAVSLDNEYFSPTEFLEKAASILSILAAGKGLALKTEISSELPVELYGDTQRLQQVIINLAGNAIKFTEKGEVNVSLIRPAPAWWAIQVSDSGAGISKEAQEYIFEPFRRVDNNITRESRGSGLGLSITKQLVELMGGQIALQSDLGIGSVFTVTLPITNAPGE